jgi:hypothetical protein
MGCKVAKKLGDGPMALFGYPGWRRRTMPGVPGGRHSQSSARLPS